MKQSPGRVVFYLPTMATTLPLHLGTPEQFASLRQLLEQADYTEAGVCRRIGIPSMLVLNTAMAERSLTEELTGPLDALMRLFIEGNPLTASEMDSWLGQPVIDLLTGLGLLVGDAATPQWYASPVSLHPCRSLYFVCDRGATLGSISGDVVYPAILENTHHFLSLLPATPCDRFLDLGTGTGVAAFLAATGYARHAWASDITERSVHFTEFNRRLNRIENVTICKGDLYAPVEGQTFDRIVTHPPYVPVASPTAVFRDGGEDGEQIVRRIIEGLPDYLSSGGRFYCQTLASDREGEPLEDRVRKWLGEKESDFDIAVVSETARAPSDFIGRAMQNGNHLGEELRYWSRVYRELKVLFLVYGCILIQRKREERPAFTARVQKGPLAGLPQTEWLLNVQTRLYQEDGASHLLEARPFMSENLHMAVVHRVHGRELKPEEFLLRVNHPFETEGKCKPWIAGLVRRCDGATTGRELFEDLCRRGEIDPESEPEEFAGVLRSLVSSGFLELEEFPIPRS